MTAERAWKYMDEEVCPELRRRYSNLFWSCALDLGRCDKHTLVFRFEVYPAQVGDPYRFWVSVPRELRIWRKRLMEETENEARKFLLERLAA